MAQSTQAPPNQNGAASNQNAAQNGRAAQSGHPPQKERDDTPLFYGRDEEQGTFMYVTDALEIGRIRFYIGQEQDGKASNGHVAFAGATDLAPVMHCLLRNQGISGPYMYPNDEGKAGHLFRGGSEKDGEITTRSLWIQDVAVGDVAPERPIHFIIMNGPGERLDSGAYVHKKDEGTYLTLRLSRHQAAELAFVCKHAAAGWVMKGMPQNGS